MGRENCSMCDLVSNIICCSYFDYATRQCISVTRCPEGLDNEDEGYDDEDGLDDFDINEEWD